MRTIEITKIGEFYYLVFLDGNRIHLFTSVRGHLLPYSMTLVIAGFYTDEDMPLVKLEDEMYLRDKQPIFQKGV